MFHSGNQFDIDGRFQMKSFIYHDIIMKIACQIKNCLGISKTYFRQAEPFRLIPISRTFFGLATFFSKAVILDSISMIRVSISGGYFESLRYGLPLLE